MRQRDFQSVAFGNARSCQISPATSQIANAMPHNPKTVKIMPAILLRLCLLGAIIFTPFVTCAQTIVRWDFPNAAYTTNVRAPQPGAMVPVLSLPFSTVQICATWTVGTPACNSLATTYQTMSVSPTCPSNAQLTPPLGGACTNQVDTAGNVGAWLAVGTYAYVLTTSYGAFGPYQFQVAAGGGSGGSPGGPTNAIQNNNSGTFGGSSFATINASTGAIVNTTILSSVNTQINVMAPPYNATGNGTTDDTPAVCAAQAAAVQIAKTQNTQPPGLYFPNPTVSYKVSMDNHSVGGNPTCYWQGVSLIGQPTSLGEASPAQYSVVLRSLPGEDILNIPDPTTTTGNIKVYGGWAIQNITFVLDNSVTSTFSNRFPGRSFDDAAMTASSAVLQTTGGNVSCGDVGQAVQVNGAGSGGSNLVTTVASVSPCWAAGASIPTRQTVTLAASASTTVTGAHGYISVVGLPVTTTIGNAAIALDMEDGNTSHWVASSYVVGNYGRMDNVVFQNTSGMANHIAALWSQGSAWLYGVKVDNFNVYGEYAGIVQTSTVLNSALQSSSGDFEQWNHGLFLGVATPWISVNGLSNKILHTQDTSFFGFQILTDSNTAGDVPSAWIIEHSFECPYGSSCGIGDNITGSFHHINAALTSGSSIQFGYMNTVGSVCENCGLVNTSIGGYGNRILGQNINNPNFVEDGLANEVTATFNPGSNGIPSNYRKTQIPYKGSNNIGGRYTPDFLTDGNYSTPYNHDDFFIWPNDLLFSNATPWASVVIPDSTSPTGYYINWAPTVPYTDFSQLPSGLNVGTNLPDTGVTLYMMVKCPTAVTSFTVMYGNTGSTHPTFTQSCTTSYAMYAFPVTYTSGDNGLSQNIWNEGADSFYAAWVDIQPYQAVMASSVTVNGAGPSRLQLKPGTFSALNTAFPCNSSNEGSTSPVTDSTTNTWGATITGSGSDHVLAYCDGTNWTVAAQ